MSKLIELYARSPDGEWKLKDATNMTATLTLKSIKCKFSVAAVYEKVAFRARPEGPEVGAR